MTAKSSKNKGKLRLDPEMCKACGYCIEYCPNHSLAFSKCYNSKGYYPVEWTKGSCNGCAICALMCPEGVIEVWRE